MVKPELALISRALAGLGRAARFVAADVAVDDDKVTILKADALTGGDVFVDELATRASGKKPTVWSLKVGEFLDDHLGVLRPHVFALGLRVVFGGWGHHRTHRLKARHETGAGQQAGHNHGGDGHRADNQYLLAAGGILTFAAEFFSFAHARDYTQVRDFCHKLI